MRLRGRRTRGVERAPGARVARDVVLDASGGAGRIVLGPGAVVARGCRLQAAAGACIRIDGELGEGCRVLAHDAVAVDAGARLGERCVLTDAAPVDDDPERPVRLQGLRTEPMLVGADARLGPGVAVLRGASVGAGARVLAGSVVTGPVPPGARAAGTPARVTPAR